MKESSLRIRIISEFFSILTSSSTEVFSTLCNASRVIRIKEDEIGSLREKVGVSSGTANFEQTRENLVTYLCRINSFIRKPPRSELFLYVLLRLVRSIVRLLLCDSRILGS